MREWYECSKKEFDKATNVLDDYDLEECDYNEEDETIRIPLVEYDQLLFIEKRYHELLREKHMEY